MKRVNLNPTAARSMADLVAELRRRAENSSTVAFGQKDMGTTGNVMWERPDGTSENARNLDAGLEAAKDRIDQAIIDSDNLAVAVEVAIAEAEEAQGRLDTLDDTTLPAVRQEIEQAAQEAATNLAELEGQLANYPTNDVLQQVRDDLATTQQAVTSAQESATAANTAATAASQAALEAAGIAASKGRVIVQETEPTGADRTASNIWIKPVPDDPDTEVEEKAVTYVYLEATDEWQPTTSSELAQAAQNALDAREAAQQAQQRADTAISNATAAQSAAEAAQTTANQATLDAADAHNAAVEAQAQVTAKIDAGDSILVNGGWETVADGGSVPGWPNQANHSGRSRVVLDKAAARSGNRYLELTPTDANVYPESVLYPVEPGRTLYARMWGKYVGGDSGSRLSILYRSYDAEGNYLQVGYVSELFYPPADLPVGEWVLIDGDFTVPADVHFLALAPHSTGPSTDVFHVDDFQVLDVTEARAAQAAADAASELAASKVSPEEMESAILSSANGKNSITVANAAPDNAANPGVRPGDIWWRIDATSSIFGQWAWNGSSWIARPIRSEVIANVDVHKLTVTGSIKTAAAVIEKLWVDGLMARAITAQSLTVAGGNLLPDPNALTSVGQGAWGSTVFVWDATNGYFKKTTAVSGNQQLSLNPNGNYTSYPLRPGEEFAISFDVFVAGGTSSVRAAIYQRTAAGAQSFVGDNADGLNPGTYTEVPAGAWTRVTRIYRVPSDVIQGGFGLQLNSVPTSATELRIRNISILRRQDAVTIKDGAVQAQHVTASESLSAKIASFLSVEAKNLIVTEAAVLQHATLLGQTIVQDINVQGKLVGEDGVFNGTVDFANINVTGELLAAAISGEYIYGTEIEGALIKTDDSLPGQVILSNTGYVDSGGGGQTMPGISVIPASMEGMASPPGIGAGETGMYLNAGRTSAGERAWISLERGVMRITSRAAGDIQGELRMDSSNTNLTFEDGNARSTMVMWPDSAGVSSHSKISGDGSSSGLSATPYIASISSSKSGGDMGTIRATTTLASIEVVEWPYLVRSGIYASKQHASVQYLDSDDIKRALRVTDTGIWVEITSASNVLTRYNLEKTARDSGWISLSPYSGVSGAGSPAFRVLGNVVFFRGTLTKSSNWVSGWNRLTNDIPTEYSPNFNALRAGTSSVANKMLLQVTDAGRFEMFLDASYSGSTTVQLSPMFYPVG